MVSLNQWPDVGMVLLLFNLSSSTHSPRKCAANYAAKRNVSDDFLNIDTSRLMHLVWVDNNSFDMEEEA